MSKRYPPEQRARAVKMVLDHLDEYRSVYAACKAIGPKVGVGVESLRQWTVQAQIDAQQVPGPTTAERQRIKDLVQSRGSRDAAPNSEATTTTVRSEYERPDGADELPPADAMIVAPATCNTLAKWTAGISDTLPLGLVIEAVGKGLPVVAMPFGNRAQLSFPAIGEAMGKLQAVINSAMPSSTSIPTVTAPRTVNASSCQISSAIASGEFVQRPVQFNTVILSGVHGTDPGAPS